MPKFYFHLYNDLNVPDREGAEFPDLPAARDNAVKQARALVGDTARRNGQIVLGHRIDIEDEAGKVVDSVSFGDAVTIDPESGGITPPGSS